MLESESNALPLGYTPIAVSNQAHITYRAITLVGKVGLEPTTALSTWFTVRGDTNYTVLTHNGGIEGNRTPDPLLARQMLSQLSYNPMYNILSVLLQSKSKEA